MTSSMKSIRQEVEAAKWAGTRDKIRADMAARGMKPVTEQEFRQAVQKSASVRDTDCPLCHGSGYFKSNPEALIGEKNFGKIETCPNYRKKSLESMNLLQFGIEKSELGLDWQAVKNKIGHMRSDAQKAVQAVLPAYEAGHGMIALLGSYGQGKTLVGKILISTALRAGKRAAYANMARILDDIRLAFDEKEYMTRALLEHMEFWNGLEILFIDELDKVNATDWALERMFQLLDQRYSRAIREEALTVVASNKELKELDGYLVSRLQDNRLGPVLYLNGDDFRKVMPKGVNY